MSRFNFKLSLAFVAFLFLGLGSHMVKADELASANSVDADSRREPAATAATSTTSGPIIKDPEGNIFKNGSHFEIGVNYVQWNEVLTLARGAQTTKGYANYAGPGIQADYSYLRGRWAYGAAAAVAGGKAVSAGFDPSFSFADGVDRLWTGGLVNAYIEYRINTQIMFGVGALARYRTIDWTPGDTTITAQPREQMAFGPSLNMRWLLTDHVSIAQSFAASGPDTETQWNLTLAYVL